MIAMLSLTLFSIACAVFTGVTISNFISDKRLTSSVIDPGVFATLLFLMLIGDFIALYIQPISADSLFERGFASFSVDTRLYSFALFALQLLSFAIGVVVATVIPFKPMQPRELTGEHTSVVLMYSVASPVFLCCAAFYLFKTISNPNATYQSIFHELPLLDVGIAIMVPMCALFCSTSKCGRSMCLAVAPVALGMICLGKRGPVLALMLILAAGWINIDWVIRKKYLVIGLVFLPLFLTTQRYIFREADRHETIGAFLDSKGGVLNAFFGTSEISNAESFTAVAAREKALRRPPQDLVLGVLLAPIPRSLCPLKPDGTSAYFTNAVSPHRWKTTKSEILTTGFGDCLIHFGRYFSPCAIFVLGFLWTRLLGMTCGNKRIEVFWLYLCLWGLYVFVRCDTYNLARFLWLSVLLWLVFQVVCRIRMMEFNDVRIIWRR